MRKGRTRRQVLALTGAAAAALAGCVGGEDSGNGDGSEGTTESAVIEDGELQMTLHLAPNVDVRSVIDRAQTALPGAEMVKRRRISRSDTERELDRTTFSQHLRKAEKSIFERLFAAAS